MPEISQSDLNEYHRYQRLGPVTEVEGKIRHLEKDNRKYRARAQELDGKVPKADQVVVSKADADLLPTYKELGTPQEIKGKLTKGEEAQKTAAKLQQKDNAVKFVKAVGIHDDAVDALLDLPALQGATFEVRKGKIKNDKNEEVDAEIGYITLAGENQKAMAYSDALDKVPSLKGLKQAEAASTTAQPTGKPFVKQGSGAGAGAKSKWDQIREEEAAKQKKAKDDTTSGTRSLEEAMGMTPT